MSHGFSLVWCLAAHTWELLWDFRNCHTLGASPAELGGLHVVLDISFIYTILNKSKDKRQRERPILPGVNPGNVRCDGGLLPV